MENGENKNQRKFAKFLETIGWTMPQAYRKKAEEIKEKKESGEYVPLETEKDELTGFENFLVKIGWTMPEAYQRKAADIRKKAEESGTSALYHLEDKGPTKFGRFLEKIGWEMPRPILNQERRDLIVREMEERRKSGETSLELRTEGLVKKYGKRTVANQVSINVKQGEIVGLLGPNGAGKTTTFYMTIGLIIPNAGKIYLDNREITKLPFYKRAQLGLGYLPQEASVFRKMTVENNIKSVLEMTNFNKRYQQEKLETLIEEFRLQKVRKSLGDQLSGGERRRTEIARCLAMEPKFIMLDEPFAGVDPIAVQDIQDIVWRLKDQNIGILITDHNVDETLSITDRAYMLFEGKILFQGTAEELASNPIVKEKYLGRDFELKKKTHLNNE